MIVVAGFASTIFMPLTGWLDDRYGWRGTLLVLAAARRLPRPRIVAAVMLVQGAAAIRLLPAGGTRVEQCATRRYG